MRMFFIFGFIINAIIIGIVYVACDGFFGCGNTAEALVLLSLAINFPVSMIVVKFASTLLGKVFLMGFLGTIVNAFIFKLIFKLIGSLFKLGARGIKELAKDNE